MARRIIDRDRGYQELLRNVGAARGGSVVKVGIQGPKATAPKSGDNSDGLDLVTVASFHEFGLGVPERSFIRAWADENGDRIKAVLRRLAQQVAKGKISVDQALEQFGVWAVGQVQMRITRGIGPALAPSTVAQKGSSVALVDTGQLKSAITYVASRGLGASLGVL